MRTWAYERKFVMPVRRLPSNPNLEHLKYQAKDLLKETGAEDISSTGEASADFGKTDKPVARGTANR